MLILLFCRSSPGITCPTLHTRGCHFNYKPCLGTSTEGSTLIVYPWRSTRGCCNFNNACPKAMTDLHTYHHKKTVSSVGSPGKAKICKCQEEMYTIPRIRSLWSCSIYRARLAGWGHFRMLANSSSQICIAVVRNATSHWDWYRDYFLKADCPSSAGECWCHYSSLKLMILHKMLRAGDLLIEQHETG